LVLLRLGVLHRPTVKVVGVFVRFRAPASSY
jgi:hypothetical protein